MSVGWDGSLAIEDGVDCTVHVKPEGYGARITVEGAVFGTMFRVLHFSGDEIMHTNRLSFVMSRQSIGDAPMFIILTARRAGKDTAIARGTVHAGSSSWQPDKSCISTREGQLMQHCQPRQSVQTRVRGLPYSVKDTVLACYRGPYWLGSFTWENQGESRLPPPDTLEYNAFVHGDMLWLPGGLKRGMGADYAVMAFARMFEHNPFRQPLTPRLTLAFLGGCKEAGRYLPEWFVKTLETHRDTIVRPCGVGVFEKLLLEHDAKWLLNPAHDDREQADSLTPDLVVLLVNALLLANDVMGREDRGRFFVCAVDMEPEVDMTKLMAYAKSENYRDGFIFYFRPNHCLLLAQKRDSVPAAAMQKVLSNEEYYIKPRVFLEATNNHGIPSSTRCLAPMYFRGGREEKPVSDEAFKIPDLWPVPKPIVAKVEEPEVVWTDEMLQAWFAPSPPQPDPYTKRGRGGRRTQHGANQDQLSNATREKPWQTSGQRDDDNVSTISGSTSRPLDVPSHDTRPTQANKPHNLDSSRPMQLTPGASSRGAGATQGRGKKSSRQAGQAQQTQPPKAEPIQAAPPARNNASQNDFWGATAPKAGERRDEAWEVAQLDGQLKQEAEARRRAEREREERIASWRAQEQRRAIEREREERKAALLAQEAEEDGGWTPEGMEALEIGQHIGRADRQILSAAQAPVAGTTAASLDGTSRGEPKTTFSIDKPSNGRRQQEANREAPVSSNMSTRQPLQRQHKKGGAVTSSDLADESHVAEMGQAVTPQALFTSAAPVVALEAAPLPPAIHITVSTSDEPASASTTSRQQAADTEAVSSSNLNSQQPSRRQRRKRGGARGRTSSVDAQPVGMLQVVVGCDGAVAVSGASATTDASTPSPTNAPTVPMPDAPPSLLVVGPVDASNVSITDPMEDSLTMPERMMEQPVVRPSTPIGPIIPINTTSDSNSFHTETGTGGLDAPTSPVNRQHMRSLNVSPLDNIDGVSSHSLASVHVAAEEVDAPPPETQGLATQLSLAMPKRMIEQPIVRPSTPIGPISLPAEGPSDLLAVRSSDSGSLMAEANVGDVDVPTLTVGSRIVDIGTVSPLTLTDDASINSLATVPFADHEVFTPPAHVDAASSSAALEALIAIARAMTPPPEMPTSSGNDVTQEAAIASSDSHVVLASSTDETPRLQNEGHIVDSASVLPLTGPSDMSNDSLTTGSIADQELISQGHEAITPSAAVEALALIFGPINPAPQTVSFNGTDAPSVDGPASTLPLDVRASSSLVPFALTGDETFAASTGGPSVRSLITQAAPPSTSTDGTIGLRIEMALPETRGVTPPLIMTHDHATMAIEMDAPGSPLPLAPSVNRPFTASEEEAPGALASASPMLDIAIDSEAPQHPSLAGPISPASSSGRASPMAMPRGPEERIASTDALRPPTLVLPSAERAIGGVSIDVMGTVAPSPGLTNAEAFTGSPLASLSSSPRSSPATSPLSAFTRTFSPQHEHEIEQQASAIPIADGSLIINSASGRPSPAYSSPVASPPVLAATGDSIPASEPSQELDAGLLPPASLITPDVAVQRLSPPSPPLSPTALTGALDSVGTQARASTAHLQGTAVQLEEVQLLLSSTAMLNMQEPRSPSPPLPTGTEGVSRPVSPGHDADALGGPAHVAITLDAEAAVVEGGILYEGPLVERRSSPVPMPTQPIQHVVLLTTEGGEDQAAAGVADEMDAHIFITMQGLVQDADEGGDTSHVAIDMPDDGTPPVPAQEEDGWWHWLRCTISGVWYRVSTAMRDAATTVAQWFTPSYWGASEASAEEPAEGSPELMV